MTIYQPTLIEGNKVPDQMTPSHFFTSKGALHACMKAWGYPPEDYIVNIYDEPYADQFLFLNRTGKEYVPKNITLKNPYRFIHHGAKVIWNDPANADYGEHAEDHARTEYVVDSINGSKAGTAAEDDDIILIYDPKGNYGEAEVPAHELREAPSATDARISRYVREADAYFISLLKFANRRMKKAERRARRAEELLDKITAKKNSNNMKTMIVWKAPKGNRQEKTFEGMVHSDIADAGKNLLKTIAMKAAGEGGNRPLYPSVGLIKTFTTTVESGLAEEGTVWYSRNGDVYYLETEGEDNSQEKPEIKN